MTPQALCLMLVYMVATANAAVSDIDETSDGMPPVIVEQGEREMWYKPSEKIELRCAASGFPPPTYVWKKNDRRLVINGLGIQQEAGRGTIIINADEIQSTANHDGIYQCFATNKFGTAVTIKTVLRKAMLDPFRAIQTPRYHRAAVGTSLSLRCQPPGSYPAGKVYWGENRYGPKIRAIENTERISSDYDGGLHFTNIEMHDGRKGMHYVCIVHNYVLRHLVQGDDQVIQPHQSATVIPKYEPPTIMWSSPTKDIAIRGQNKTMKCIFAGYPTPKVTWYRLDATMPTKNTNASFGQELVINSIDFNDSGRYQCTATNTKEGTNVAVRDFSLTVESPPYWRNDVLPQNVNASEEDDVEFECNVHGVPKPTVAWYINGEPLSVSRGVPRRTVTAGAGGSTLRLFNVTTANEMVVQCNASNPHGYVFANAYLTVRAEPPVYLVEPKTLTKVPLGHTAVLQCRVSGAPKPTIIWQKGSDLIDVQDLHDPRITQLPSGDLKIENVLHYDEDTYQCYTFNKFGSDRTIGRLMITNQTTIAVVPVGQTVTSSDDVIMTCQATVDSRQAVRYEWVRDANGDGRLSDAEMAAAMGLPPDDADTTDATAPRRPSIPADHRWLLQDGGRRLVIRRSRVTDTGNYFCRATTDVDTSDAMARVVVRDRPEKPLDVRMASCTSASAEITWSPGAENNSPITSYIIHYNTSHDEATLAQQQLQQQQSHETASSRDARHNISALHPAVTVSGSATSARVRPLTPWTGYSFYVTAENAVGRSERSSVAAVCRTPATKPQRNPRRVCTENRRPGQLVIVWEPMLPAEHNGDDFHYIVFYRRRRSGSQHSGVDPVRVEVRDWRRGELVIDGLTANDGAGSTSDPTAATPAVYQEYEVAVQAANVEGPAPSASVEKVAGHTGEDVPAVIPRDLKIVEVNATAAELTWTAVDESPVGMRGFFRGYQIQFWRANDTDTIRTVDVSAGNWQPCRPLTPHASDSQTRAAGDLPPMASGNEDERPTESTPGSRRNWSAELRRGLINNLWPYTTIVVGVRVMNGRLVGRLSDTITFQTLEGVPGQVPMLWASERGAHHLKISWMSPFDINGNLIGYEISYREAANNSEVLDTISLDPQQTSKKLRNLKDDTAYVITIWALTEAGRGVEKVSTEVTIANSVPDRPIIDSLDIGYDWVNVSWRPSGEPPTANPASEYVVQYQLQGAVEWDKTDPVIEHNWVNITGLIHGMLYVLQVLSIEKHGDGMLSPPIEFTAGLQSPPEAVVERDAPWIATGLCSVIAVIVAVVLLVFVLRRRRHQGKYAVHENERRHGANGGNLYDEAQFGEYVRTDILRKKGTMHSLDSSSRSDEDDGTDSLGVYEDVDPIKFTDDGSFVDPQNRGVAGSGAVESTCAGGGYVKIIDDKNDGDGTNTSALSSLV